MATETRGVLLLSEFLTKRGLRRSEFADALPCSRPLLTMWLAANRIPNRSNAVAIQQATNGDVPVESWGEATGRRPVRSRARRSARRPSNRTA